MYQINLRQEILNHLRRHTVANRLTRVRHSGIKRVTVIYSAASNIDAGILDKDLLKRFEDYYWDLAVLNSQRGYQRGEDNHYRI